MTKRLTLKKLRKINNTNKRISKRQRRSRKISGGETLEGDVSLSPEWRQEKSQQTKEIESRCKAFEEEIEKKYTFDRSKIKPTNDFVLGIVTELKSIMKEKKDDASIKHLDDVNHSKAHYDQKLFLLSLAIYNIRKKFGFITNTNQDSNINFRK